VWYIIITKGKEIKEMKRTYKITIAVGNEISVITLTNPPRKFLKVGYTEYSGAKILNVEKIK